MFHDNHNDVVPIQQYSFTHAATRVPCCVVGLPCVSDGGLVVSLLWTSVSCLITGGREEVVPLRSREVLPVLHDGRAEFRIERRDDGG